MKNYKEISELGLEVIKLEDQVLLVDRDLNKGGDTKYYLNGFIGRLYSNPQYQSYDILDFDGTLLERVRIKSNEVPYRIIASTKPLEGLPLLVIEDEAMLNALNLITESKIETESTKLILIGSYTTGYNKAKETYKFTEEDLRGVFLIGLMDNLSSVLNERELSESEIEALFQKQLKRVTKKELCIEVEDVGRTHYIKDDNNGFNDVTGINFHKYEWIPKITNGQIKAVLK